MSNFEKELMILLKNKYIDVDDLKNFIDKSVNDQVNGNVNQMEFIRLLPVIIKNTNEFNFSWLSQIKEYSSIPGFLDTFINNIFLISYEEYQFLFLCILDEFKYIPIQKNHIRLLFQNILNYRVKVNYDSIYDMVNDIYPDMIPEMLLFFINHDYSCDDILSLFTKNNGKFLFLLYENIDIVLEHVHIDKLFYLKELVKDNESIYNYVISAIKLNSKKNVINLIKTLYLRVVVTHNYYHNLNYINEESFQNILEIIYLIIDDIYI